jgi:hypothetical protein
MQRKRSDPGVNTDVRCRATGARSRTQFRPEKFGCGSGCDARSGDSVKLLRRRAALLQLGCVRDWLPIRPVVVAAPGTWPAPKLSPWELLMHASARLAFLHCSETTSLASRTTVYGPVRTVVWQGSAGDCRPCADHVHLHCSELPALDSTNSCTHS